MPRRNSESEQTRKERKRRARNSQSRRDLAGPAPVRCRICRIDFAAEARLVDHIEAVHPWTLKEKGH